MINFVAGSPCNAQRLMSQYGAGHCTGQMSNPRSGDSMQFAIEHGLPWCLDNGCYKRYDPDAIINMLKRKRGLSGCKFAVVPDVVCDHAATRLLFNAWIGTYQAYGYPAAFVLQNGITSARDVPWDSIAAVFIGGDNAFKYSDIVRTIVQDAKSRGKWVHMGRVNTLRRIHYAISIGCDSSDGTGFAIARRQYRFAQAFTQIQHSLWETI